MEGTEGIRSVTRALLILKAFADEPELSLTEISRKTDLSKATTFRILATLEAEGFVYRRDNARYCLGVIMVQLGSAAEKKISLRSVSNPFLKHLSEATNETVSLNVVMDRKRLCIKLIESMHTVRDFIETDQLLPIYRGASGKAMLAFLPESEIEEIISAIQEPEFDYTLLRRQLEEIKEAGYAVSQNDRVNGAAAIAAPIFDREGRLAGGIGLSGAALRFTEEKQQTYIDLVRRCAADISYHLGNNQAI